MGATHGGGGEDGGGFTRRALLLGGLQVGAFTLIAGRLYQLQVMEGRRFGPLAEDNRISQRGLVPVRGRILDRHGRVLASNVESFRVTMLPGEKTRMRVSLAALQPLLKLSSDDIERILARARGASRVNPVELKAGLDFDTIAQVGLLIPHLPGVETEIELQRTYSDGRVAGHVVGYVGSVDRYAMDDAQFLKLPHVRVGKAGVELGMDVELRGSGGARKFEVDARGRIVRHLGHTDPTPGNDVVVTIDTEFQARVMQRLSGERRAAAVVMDVRTGEVAAMVSIPAFDPNQLTIHFEDTAWEKLQADENKPLLNRAISGQYPPGSTFKMVTALAALEAGAVDIDEHITCRGSFELADRTYRCWRRDGHGRLDLNGALKESCDVYFYTLAERIGVDKIASMARRLGLGQIYAAGIGAQKPGLIPDTGWKRAALGRTWLRGETILAGIGQGYVLATPLQLAVMTARLATGRAVVPTLVRRPGDAVPEQQVFPPLDVPQAGLEAVRRAMVGVVNDAGGTGGNAALEDNAVVIAGKTGTSQVRSADAGSPDDPFEHRDHALFVSYFPADAPRYSVAVVVEHGGAGGTMAAPIVRDIIAMIMAGDPVAPRPHAEGGNVTAPPVSTLAGETGR